MLMGGGEEVYRKIDAYVCVESLSITGSKQACWLPISEYAKPQSRQGDRCYRKTDLLTCSAGFRTGSGFCGAMRRDSRVPAESLIRSGDFAGADGSAFAAVEVLLVVAVPMLLAPLLLRVAAAAPILIFAFAAPARRIISWT
jgi:hypothetical protein